MDPQLIRAAMVALGALPQRIQQIQRMPFRQAVLALEALKVEARKRYKRTAFEWHPDRNREDPDAEARFKALGTVLAELEKLRLQPPAPRVQFVHIPRATPYGSAVTYTTTTASTTTSSTYNAMRAVFIRIG